MHLAVPGWHKLVDTHGTGFQDEGMGACRLCEEKEWWAWVAGGVSLFLQEASPDATRDGNHVTGRRGPRHRRIFADKSQRLTRHLKTAVTNF